MTTEVALRRLECALAKQVVRLRPGTPSPARFACALADKLRRRVEARIVVDGRERRIPALYLTPEQREDLRRQHALLHPNGACTCFGDGECDWCRRTAAAEQVEIRRERRRVQRQSKRARARRRARRKARRGYV